ncbi:hypothetical protein K070079E91_07900 [Eisenbergiella porci]
MDRIGAVFTVRGRKEIWFVNRFGILFPFCQKQAAGILIQTEFKLEHAGH